MDCNLQLAEAFYVSLSVFEVTLRNALCRELETMTGYSATECFTMNQSAGIFTVWKLGDWYC